MGEIVQFNREMMFYFMFYEEVSLLLKFKIVQIVHIQMN